MTVTQCCKTCRFWSAMEPEVWRDGDWQELTKEDRQADPPPHIQIDGICRRYPPVLLKPEEVDSDHLFSSCWGQPTTESRLGCGEWHADF